MAVEHEPVAECERHHEHADHADQDESHSHIRQRQPRRQITYEPDETERSEREPATTREEPVLHIVGGR